jgi:hypothetical protein
MSRRKPMAALAAAAATLAIAAPAATASATTTAPAPNVAGVGRLVPGSAPCQFLIAHIRFAVLTGNAPLANVFSNVFIRSGCGGAAI